MLSHLRERESGPHKLASTGFNLARLRGTDIDPSRKASTHKYGVATMQPPHPSQGTSDTTSKNRDSYQHPKLVLSPTYTRTSHRTVTEKQIDSSSPRSRRPSTPGSRRTYLR